MTVLHVWCYLTTNHLIDVSEPCLACTTAWNKNKKIWYDCNDIMHNRSFLSCLLSLCQNVFVCNHWNENVYPYRFIFMQIKVIFIRKVLTRGLVLKQRHKVTSKWATASWIANVYVSNSALYGLMWTINLENIHHSSASDTPRSFLHPPRDGYPCRT